MAGSKKCPPGCECGKHQNNKRPWQKGRKLSAEHKEKLRRASTGRKMPEETRLKMSETKRRQARSIQEEMPYILPKRKRCTKCGKTKNVEGGFNLRKIKLKSGYERLAVEPRCRKCVAEATAAWREKKKQEGKLKEIQKGYYKNRLKNPDHREYQRIYQNGKRREEGKKERRRKATVVKSGAYLSGVGIETLPIDPIADWLREKNITAVPGVSDPVITAIRNRLGSYKEKISLDLVDRILTGMEEPWVSHELYPVTD